MKILSFFLFLKTILKESINRIFLHSRVEFTLLCVIASIGLVFLASASIYKSEMHFGNIYYYVLKQLGFFIIGLFVIILLQQTPIKFIGKISTTLLFLSFVAILLPFLFADNEINGADRWVSIFGMRFQPAEISKPMFFVFVANVCSESFKNKSEYKIRMIVMFVITMLYISILWQQPSYSMSIIILLSCLVVVFISGIPILYFALSLIFVASIVIAGIYAEPYRAQRILALLSPGEHASGSSYQWLKAREAIYSGGGFGVGLGNSTYKKNILPEPHNDFIMAIVIEEVGVFFASAFAILMFYFMIRMLNIARKALQTDMFAGLLGTAMVVSIMIGIIINLGFVIGVLPVTGIPFPLLSYGGSFMIYTMICVGVIFRINYEQKSK